MHRGWGWRGAATVRRTGLVAAVDSGGAGDGPCDAGSGRAVNLAPEHLGRPRATAGRQSMSGANPGGEPTNFPETTKARHTAGLRRCRPADSVLLARRIGLFLAARLFPGGGIGRTGFRGPGGFLATGLARLGLGGI